MEVLTATVAFLVIALYVAGAFAVRRLRQMETRTQVREHFYHGAHKLVADSGVPDDVAHFVRFLVHSVDSRWPTLLLLWSYTTGRVWSRTDHPHRSRLMACLDGLPEGTRSKVLEVVIVYVVACSYNNALLGYFLRRSLLRGLFQMKTTNDARGHRHIKKVRAEVTDTRAPTLADAVAGRAGCGFSDPPPVAA